MSPLGLAVLGAGIVLVFAAYRDVSPIGLVLDTLGFGGATAATGTAAPLVPKQTGAGLNLPPGVQPPQGLLGP